MQPAKALAPMAVTLLAMVSCVIAEQPLKASGAMAVTVYDLLVFVLRATSGMATLPVRPVLAARTVASVVEVGA